MSKIFVLLIIILISCSKPKPEIVQIGNLIWQKCSLGLSGSDCSSGSATQLAWEDAVKACENHQQDNKKWRLPSVEELATLITCKDGKKVSRENISCDWDEKELFSNVPLNSFSSELFPGTQRDFYWTSSTNEYKKEDGTKQIVAFHIDFDTGMVANVEKKYKRFVRCVTE